MEDIEINGNEYGMVKRGMLKKGIGRNKGKEVWIEDRVEDWGWVVIKWGMRKIKRKGRERNWKKGENEKEKKGKEN